MSDAVTLRLAALEARVAALEAGGAKPASSAPGKSGGGLVADDRELDSQYGDPLVKKDPTRWTGPSYAGCKMSECPAEYLMVLADLYDWMGDQDDAQGKTWTSKKPGAKPQPASSFKRKDAARARGWANRNRDMAPSQSSDSTPDDYTSNADSIPF